MAVHRRWSGPIDHRFPPFDSDEPSASRPTPTTRSFVPAAASDAEFETMIVTELMSPPDETGFIEGVRVREPVVAASLDSATLLDFASRSCRLRDGYIMGSRPTPTELLAADIADEVGLLDSDDAASAIANSAQGSICDVTVVEAS